MKIRSIIIAATIALVSATALATAPRFTVETIDGETMVADGVTGLTWQQLSTTTSGVDWKSALAHCEELSFGGHGDWRMPDVVELSTLVDDKASASPAINTVYFAGFNAGSGYWSSTTARKSATSAYAVYFNEQNSTVGRGGVGVLAKTGTALVLCVRGSAK
jgi:hypothetical protein